MSLKNIFAFSVGNRRYFAFFIYRGLKDSKVIQCALSFYHNWPAFLTRFRGEAAQTDVNTRHENEMVFKNCHLCDPAVPSGSAAPGRQHSPIPCHASGALMHQSIFQVFL